MTDVSPEFRQAVIRYRQLLRFKPREAVDAAFLETEEQSPLISGWALSRLIAWAFYDQHESKRIPKDQRKKRAAKRPFRPRYAFKAGQLYLLHHLYHFFRKYEPAWRFQNLTLDDAGIALSMYLETGQLKKNFGHSGLSLATLHNDVERRQQLLIVYHVMDFLVRADLSGRDDIRKVEVARYFVKTHLDLKDQATKKRISESAIDKVWDRHKAAAPYIYAFYPRVFSVSNCKDAAAEAKVETDADWVSCIAQLVAKSNIDECLGHAAFATDVLAKTRTLDVRVNDFVDVPRVKPLSRPFDADEEIGIKSFDKKAAIKD